MRNYLKAQSQYLDTPSETEIRRALNFYGPVNVIEAIGQILIDAGDNYLGGELISAAKRSGDIKKAGQGNVLGRPPKTSPKAGNARESAYDGDVRAQVFSGDYFKKEKTPIDKAYDMPYGC